MKKEMIEKVQRLLKYTLKKKKTKPENIVTPILQENTVAKLIWLFLFIVTAASFCLFFCDSFSSARNFGFKTQTDSGFSGESKRCSWCARHQTIVFSTQTPGAGYQLHRSGSFT